MTYHEWMQAAKWWYWFLPIIAITTIAEIIEVLVMASLR